MHALNPFKKCLTHTVALPKAQHLDVKRGDL